MARAQESRFTLQMLVGAGGVDPIDGNIDVEVVLADEAERWGTTVYTLANLDSLMRKWEQSGGECGAGRYFWADHMLIVRRLDADNRPYAFEWGGRVRMRGGRGRLGQVTPPAWRSTRSL